MGVESFFPAHYPWQRLLANIAKAFEEEDDMVTYIDLAYDDGWLSFTDIDAETAFDLMKNGLIIGKYITDTPREHILYYIFVDAYVESGEYVFYSTSSDPFFAETGSVYPCFELG